MSLRAMVNFGSNCREALEAYSKHLGGKVETLMTFAEMPQPNPIPKESLGLVMHARMSLSGGELLASDVPAGQPWEPMRSAYLTLSFEAPEAAERAHMALAADGQVFMPMGRRFSPAASACCATASA